MRHSKQDIRIDGSLRGLSAKKFYQLKELSPKKVLLLAKRYAPSNLWIKLDRHKPMSQKQISIIRLAINRAAVEQVKDFPFTTPKLEFKNHPYSNNKSICEFVGISILYWRSVSTSDGTAYFVNSHEIDCDKRKGPLAFSRHAVERLLERCHGLLKFAREVNSTIIINFLKKIVTEERIRPTDTGFMLSALPFGFFPMVYDQGAKCWVCKSFLEDDMKGVPTAPDLIPESLLSSLKLR